MPLFTLRWANRGTSDQNWMVSNGDHFTLPPGYVREVQVNLHNSHSYGITADTPSPRFATATLTYTAPAGVWSLTSPSPIEWQLAQGNGIVTVRCLLSDAAGVRETPPRYDAAAPAPAVD